MKIYLIHVRDGSRDSVREIPVDHPGGSLRKGHQFKNRLGEPLLGMVNEFNMQHPEGSGKSSHSVLGRLCYSADENGNKPSETALIDNLRFLMFAGLDTTKGTLGPSASIWMLTS